MVRWVLVGLLGIAANALILGPGWNFTAHGVTDFMDLYAGGKLAHSHDLYEPGRVLQVEAQTEGWSSPTRLFMRLPIFAAVFWPMARLPYPAASAVWELICLAVPIGFVLQFGCAPRRYVAAACCWSLPAMMAVAEGQDIGFLLLWIAIVFILLRAKRPMEAGLVASLCLAKFHLFLLIPVWIIATRRWRLLYGIAIGGASLLAASFITNGWDWPVRYIRFLAKPANNPYETLMPGFHGMFSGMPYGWAFEAAAFILTAALVWIATRAGSSELGFAAALAGGLLVAPHAYLADCALLIPACLIVLQFAAARSVRMTAFFLLTPIPFVLMLAGSMWPARLAMVLLLVSLAVFARPPMLAAET